MAERTPESIASRLGLDVQALTENERLTLIEEVLTCLSLASVKNLPELIERARRDKVQAIKEHVVTQLQRSLAAHGLSLTDIFTTFLKRTRGPQGNAPARGQTRGGSGTPEAAGALPSEPKPAAPEWGSITTKSLCDRSNGERRRGAS